MHPQSLHLTSNILHRHIHTSKKMQCNAMHNIFCSGGGMRPCCKQNFDFEAMKDYMLELDTKTSRRLKFHDHGGGPY